LIGSSRRPRPDFSSASYKDSSSQLKLVGKEATSSPFIRCYRSRHATALRGSNDVRLRGDNGILSSHSHSILVDLSSTASIVSVLMCDDGNEIYKHVSAIPNVAAASSYSSPSSSKDSKPHPRHQELLWSQPVEKGDCRHVLRQYSPTFPVNDRKACAVCCIAKVECDEGGLEGYTGSVDFGPSVEPGEIKDTAFVNLLSKT